MSITATLLSGLAWSLGGGVIGYVIGSMARAEERRRWHEWARTLFGLIILALVAYTTVSGYRVSACQAQRNAALAAGIAERSEAARDERAAQRKFLLDVMTPDPKARATAFAEYLRSLDAADAKRDAAPSLDADQGDC